jgi:hypothetical protein
VGIVTAGILITAFLCFWRRHQATRRRKRWIAGIQRPLPSPPDPFEDPRDPPSPMRALYPDHPPLTNWDVRRHTLLEDENPLPLNPHNSSLGLSGLGPVYNQHQFGLAVTTPSPDMRQNSRVSLAQSSPSIYPATLPAGPDEDLMFEEGIMRPPVAPAPAPPRPPRSLLRDYSARKSVEYNPMTPPPSDSSHPSTKAPSPVMDRQPSLTRRNPSHDDVLSRRTLLDVSGPLFPHSIIPYRYSDSSQTRQCVDITDAHHDHICTYTCCILSSHDNSFISSSL